MAGHRCDTAPATMQRQTDLAKFAATDGGESMSLEEKEGRAQREIAQGNVVPIIGTLEATGAFFCPVIGRPGMA